MTTQTELIALAAGVAIAAGATRPRSGLPLLIAAGLLRWDGSSLRPVSPKARRRRGCGRTRGS